MKILKEKFAALVKKAINIDEAITQRLADEFAKENAIIVGVSKDSVKSHQRFKEKHSLPFTLLSDPEDKVLDLYGVWKTKSMCGRTFMGTERTTFLINQEGIVKKVYRKVKVKGHAQTCLLDIRA